MAAIAFAFSARTSARGGRWRTFLLLAGACATYYIAAARVESLGYLGERIAKTQIDQDERYTEVEWIAAEMNPDEWITGAGFGRGFNSPLTDTLGRLVTATHIGILTVLFKGGVAVFAVAVVLPLFWITISLFKGARIAYSVRSAMLVFYIQATLSGGYSFLVFLVVGVIYRLLDEDLFGRSDRIGHSGEERWQVQ